MESALPTSTRDRILEAGCRCFARAGRDGVSMRQLAAETRLTLPTLYHHFADKRALYASCVSHVLESAERDLRDALQAEGGPKTRLRRFTMAMCIHLLGPRALLPFVQMESIHGNDPLLRVVPQDLRDAIHAMCDADDANAAMPLDAAERLIAVTFGYALVARAAPGRPAPDWARLADSLLLAARAAAAAI